MKKQSDEKCFIRLPQTITYRYFLPATIFGRIAGDASASLLHALEQLLILCVYSFSNLSSPSSILSGRRSQPDKITAQRNIQVQIKHLFISAKISRAQT